MPSGQVATQYCRQAAANNIYPNNDFSRLRSTNVELLWKSFVTTTIQNIFLNPFNGGYILFSKIPFKNEV